MKITIESTSKVVALVENGVEFQARVWQGETESGIPVQCFVTRIAPEIPRSHPRIDELAAEFERELRRMANPRATVEAIPLRMFID